MSISFIDKVAVVERHQALGFAFRECAAVGSLDVVQRVRVGGLDPPCDLLGPVFDSEWPRTAAHVRSPTWTR